MSAQIAAHGRLAADVLSRITDSDEAVLWLGLVAFGKQAELLARHGQESLNYERCL